MCVESLKNEIEILVKRTNFGANWTGDGVLFLTQCFFYRKCFLPQRALSIFWIYFEHILSSQSFEFSFNAENAEGFRKVR